MLYDFYQILSDGRCECIEKPSCLDGFSYVNQLVRIAGLFLCFFLYRIAGLFLLCFYGNIGSWISLSIKLLPEKKGWFCGGWGLCKVSTSVPSHPTTKLATFGNYLSEYIRLDLLVLITADSYLFHNRWALQLSRGMMDELHWVGSGLFVSR